MIRNKNMDPSSYGGMTPHLWTWVQSNTKVGSSGYDLPLAGSGSTTVDLAAALADDVIFGSATGGIPEWDPRNFRECVDCGSLYVQQTDAAASGLSVTYEFRGYNQFGEIRRELLTLEDTAASQTAVAYQCAKAKIVAISGNAASDTVAIGVTLGTRRLPLFAKLQSRNSLVFIGNLNGGGLGGDVRHATPFDLASDTREHVIQLQNSVSVGGWAAAPAAVMLTGWVRANDAGL